MAIELISHFLSSASSIIAIGASLVGGGAVAAGKVPRAGPLRALALGISSRFLPGITGGAVLSQRDAEVARLQASLSSIDRDQFVVVNGPKGVGE